MTGAIILAAGGSSRLGEPKQLIMYEHKTLLQHAIDAAYGANCQPVVVVLGAYANTISEHLDYLHQASAVVVRNEHWQQGMGSSIAAGISRLMQTDTAITAAIIMVCDQPFADAALLETLMSTYKQASKGIVASAYANTVGVPALFDKKYFDTLMQLSGDEGAKKMVLQHQDDVAEVAFEKGIIDIDTVRDVEKFRAGKG